MSRVTAPASGEVAIPDRHEVEEALNRILAQPEFQSSSRLCEFLRFIVHEALAGRAGQLKAFTVAVAVYGRDENFDAQSNSIVRVEATRLRRLLDRYYAGEGADDPVKIRIPRGGYAPEFVRQKFESTEPEIAATATAKAKSRGSPARVAATLAGLALFAAAGAAGYWGARHFARPQSAPPAQPTPAAHSTYQPTISVEVLATGQSPGLTTPEAVRMRLALEHAFDRFEDIRVVENSAGDRLRVDYRLQIAWANNAAQPQRHILRVIHNASGAIVWSYPARNGFASDDPAVRQAAIHRIANAIARPFGIIFSDQQRRLPTAGHSRYACIIASYNFSARPARDRYQRARTCLQDALTSFPEFGSGASLLALLYLEGWRYGFEPRNRTKLLDEVMQLANRAQLLSPASTRSSLAAFHAEFARKNYRDAFNLGKNILTVDQNSTIAALSVAAAHVLRDDLTRAGALFERAAGMGTSFATNYNVYRFALAYRKGDKQQAARWAFTRGMGATPMGLLARVLVYHQNGQLDAANHFADRLKTRFPAVYADIPAMFDRYNMNQTLRGDLIRDLKATGLLPTLAQGASQALSVSRPAR